MSNRFPATCTTCRRRIDAGKGTYTGRQGRHCTYVHTESCQAQGALVVQSGPVEYLSPAAIDAAWAAEAQANEHYDGEPAITARCKAAFYISHGAHPDILEGVAFGLKELADDLYAYPGGEGEAEDIMGAVHVLLDAASKAGAR